MISSRPWRPLFDDIGELSAEQALLAADKGAPPYALAGCPVSCGRPRPHCWARRRSAPVWAMTNST